MRFWAQEKRVPYLNRIISHKSGPGIEAKCANCSIGQAIWRCRDCVRGNILCVLCLQSEHRKILFHRVERWNGRYFSIGALWQAGLKLYTGHMGRPCPRPDQTSHKQAPQLPFLVTQCKSILEEAAPAIGMAADHILQLLTSAITLPQFPGPAQIMMHKISQILDSSKLKLLKDLISLVRNAELEVEKENASANQKAEYNERLSPPQEDEEVEITSDLPLVDDLQEGIWEEEDSSESKGPIPRLLPRHPKYDSAGNKFITVVDVSGFHHIPVVWCSCADRSSSDTHEMQLLDLRLYPASYADISTVFTFDMLNDSRLDNLECKSSIYQYHQKLRRKTSSAFPDYVVNCYPELRWVSRQWRNLKLHKRFGHINNSKPERASLALFCPTCPQPGINLPSDWKDKVAASP